MVQCENIQDIFIILPRGFLFWCDMLDSLAGYKKLWDQGINIIQYPKRVSLVFILSKLRPNLLA